ncbi:MAG: hypothetical protein Q8N45_05515 [Anaerolineales bacterium]|nr:hypothetical protein [Anaerolineales bacterium]
MSKNRLSHCLNIAALFALLTAGCIPQTPAPPTADVDSIVAQTLAAHTVEAALTQAVQPSTDTPLPTDAPPPPPNTPTATPEETAPNPLPMTHTGIILNNGECFNFDNGAVSAPDAQCDVWLYQSAMFRQMNGAQISGYVTMEPPTRGHCAAGRYEPGDLAVQTDLYMCFISNEGNIGFIVARNDLGGVPFTGIVFDYWVFH